MVGTVKAVRGRGAGNGQCLITRRRGSLIGDDRGGGGHIGGEDHARARLQQTRTGHAPDLRAQEAAGEHREGLRIPRGAELVARRAAAGIAQQVPAGQFPVSSLEVTRATSSPMT